MDNIEARQILETHIARLRKLSYRELLRFIDNIEKTTITGKSGKKYALEIQAEFSEIEDGSLRICVAIDDGSWRALIPLTDDFTIYPELGISKAANAQ